ncbi:MAG: ribose 5-phosphate isomerase A [Thermoplasmata archaeon]|jgi:ribose 5-phosphate isomerase A
MDQLGMKINVSREALKYLDDNILLGMGSGTTVEIFIEEMSKVGFKGLRIVPSSRRIDKILREKGYSVVELEDKCDLYIDGADAVDRELRMIKGGGGALTREKIIAYNSLKRIMIVDETKMRENFEGIYLPVEILVFSFKSTMKRIRDLGLNIRLRGQDSPFITDNGNYIVDVLIESKSHLEDISRKIKEIPGVIETGFFKDLADTVLIGKKDGSVEKISKIS